MLSWKKRFLLEVDVELFEILPKSHNIQAKGKKIIAIAFSAGRHFRLDDVLEGRQATMAPHGNFNGYKDV